ncbi:hypothetical protein [Endozoicomonas elysicola]|uniref:Peptidase C39-like domain-containing protein n=1 Tax=Endozoicomonas elysicola TaxID=305900 RepID=A0A081KB35_9GAMM|nr:hypothetical protein [Endozoicomonas elysicola]KEI71361.1 hypothetical protein GV64_11955 [Endozoicomonas elysicola]
MLAFLLSLTLVVMAEPVARKECVEKTRYRLDGEVDNYTFSFPVHNVQKALQEIPGQHKYNQIKLWSCGPNAIARAMILVSGESIFLSDSEYVHFAQSVPKTLGEYIDHRFDERLNIDNHLLKTLNYPMRLFYINSFLQLITTRLSLDVGAFPVWLADYMNEYVALSNRSGFYFEFYSATTFQRMRDEIQSHLSMGHAVIPLVIMGPLNWHYLNIIGWDDITGTVMIMDTDSRIYRWSVYVLECLMNTGIKHQGAGLDDMFSLGVSILGNQISEINYFNTIFVSLQPSSDK